MFKKIASVATIFAIILAIVACIVWLRLNPPLEHSSIARSANSTSIVISLDNKGFGDVKITEVFINNGDIPTEVNMQFNHANTGFIITDDFSSQDAQNYNFVELEDISIKKGTISKDIYARQDKNQVRDDDMIYGLTILNEQPIQNVIIHYQYLSMLYQTEISIK